MIWRIIATGGALSFLVTGFSVLGDPNCISADIGGGRVVGVTCRQDSYGSFSGAAAGIIMCLLGVALLALIYRRHIGSFIRQQPSFSNTNPSIESSPTPPRILSNLNKKQGETYTHKVCTMCSEKIPVEWGHCNKCLSTRFRKIEDRDLILTDDFTQIKVCDRCKSEVHVFYPKCFQCEGTAFTHKKVKNKKLSPSITSEEAMSDFFQESWTEPINIASPEFKTCPMCAEDIKFAAKKCRYCQHMLDA